MSVSLTRFSWWLWGGKEKDSVSNGSSLNPSNEYGLVGLREYDSVKFLSRNLASNRKVNRKWHSREERIIKKQCDGVYLSGSESDGPDWSIGWVEPHGQGFRRDHEDDDGFAVLVPCYRSGSKELVEGSNNELLSAIKNLPNEFSSVTDADRIRYASKTNQVFSSDDLRDPADLVEKQKAIKFVVLHLRFDKDMAAHSACDFGGGKAEKLALAKYRQMIWQGRVLNSQFTDYELRSQGRCPLTPEETGLLLAALGFDNNTRLYLASHKVYGGEARISSLRKLFPLMENKKSLASSEERAQIKGKASLLAALDYHIAMHSDIFISASPGNMHNALVGHRTFENMKTIRPNMALIGQLFLNKNITWQDFQQAAIEGHVSRQGQIRIRKPRQSLYRYPAPDCMCHV